VDFPPAVPACFRVSADGNPLKRHPASF
jgi:hypothetical protein